ncbi:hypothetical protein D9Q98_006872 [Chlorella vulgaris]|uniref:Uncharacterized protein n=1 Tax=Chlorella vulgaris TaxID=3077 RepID=A0A9D4TJ16_CHLVU|nr:hypothetical protein D9Q98_006872 [Chlorella vulgaris]
MGAISFSLSQGSVPAASLRHRSCQRPARPSTIIRSLADEKQQLKKATEEIQQQQPSAADPGGELGRLDPLSAPPSDAAPHSSSPDPAPAASSDDASQPKPPLKKAIEEIQEQQPSAAEPGGEMGRLDPLGPPPAGSSTDASAGSPPSASPTASRPAEVGLEDPELRSALLPALRFTRKRLVEAHKDASPAAIAAAAVAAGEACGALPPLDGSQRTAVQSFFARTAEALLGDQGGAQSQLDFEALGYSAGESDHGEEPAVLRMRPHLRETFEATINSHLVGGATPRHSSGPRDSIAQGGEVGNIALQSDTHGRAEARGNPAQSGTDRAERQAEACFEEIELSGLPHASESDLERQREWALHPENRANSAAMEGDAPAAGDGMQVVNDPDDWMLAGSSSGGSSSNAESSSD